MKKILSVLLFVALFAGSAFALREFVEGTDYYTDFKQNEENMAAVLHIKFISLMPAPEEAESILKDQLKVYGNIIEAETEAAVKEQEEAEKEKTKKDKPKKSKEEKLTKEEQQIKELLEPEEEKKFKNIIGSVWFASEENPEIMEKVQYGENSSAFVRLGKTQQIVSFPDYIKFLKKERDEKRQKDRERARLLKELQQQLPPELENIDETESEEPKL
jgi:hypothetical protein